MKDQENKRAKIIMDILFDEYPKVQPALDFNNPFQLLIATILSAQCTDARVNIVTNKLFQYASEPIDFVEMEIGDLEKAIFSTGFYKQKAKNIKSCCNDLINKFNGKVPNTMEELTSLAGVGRKTASVILGNAFKIPAIAVDTHVIRLANLLGMVSTKNAVKIENKLKEILPEKYWINSTHLFMAHGRKVCIARRPQCLNCVLMDFCPSFNKN